MASGLFQDSVNVDQCPKPRRCVRKEYRRMNRREVRAYQAALNAMKNTGEYGIFVEHHRFSEAPAAHGGPAFLPWHRVFLIMYERLRHFHSQQFDNAFDVRAFFSLKFFGGFVSENLANNRSALEIKK